MGQKHCAVRETGDFIWSGLLGFLDACGQKQVAKACLSRLKVLHVMTQRLFTMGFGGETKQLFVSLFGDGVKCDFVAKIEFLGLLRSSFRDTWYGIMLYYETPASHGPARPNPTNYAHLFLHSTDQRSHYSRDKDLLRFMALYLYRYVVL